MTDKKPIFILTGNRSLAAGVAATLAGALADADRGLVERAIARSRRRAAAAPLYTSTTTERPPAPPAEASRQVRRHAERTRKGTP